MLKWPEGRMFRNTKGRPWTKDAVNCRFERLKEKLGTRYCLYLFRHSFATRMLESGLDGLTVALLLGHANPAMLSTTYQHLSHNPGHLLEQLRNATAASA
jgi:site-specific recombinase XerD